MGCIEKTVIAAEADQSSAAAQPDVHPDHLHIETAAAEAGHLVGVLDEEEFDVAPPSRRHLRSQVGDVLGIEVLATHF